MYFTKGEKDVAFFRTGVCDFASACSMKTDSSAVGSIETYSGQSILALVKKFRSLVLPIIIAIHY